MVQEQLDFLDGFERRMTRFGLGGVQERVTEESAQMVALACRVKEFPKLTDFLQEKKAFLDRRFKKLMRGLEGFGGVEKTIEERLRFCRLVKALRRKFVKSGESVGGGGGRGEALRSSIQGGFKRRERIFL